MGLVPLLDGGAARPRAAGRSTGRRGIVKTQIDIETLLLWAFRDELSKRQTSAAEGLWNHVAEQGQRGGIEIDHSPAGGPQRYAYIGLPDPDAVLIEKAVGGLEDLVIDWDQSFDAIAADLSGLISINDVSRRESPPRPPRAGWGAAGDKALTAWFGRDGARPVRDRPRDVLMVGGLRTAALVTMHAVKGTRPDWFEEPPTPHATPALKGTNAMIIGECRGRNLYTAGSCCPLRWLPSPLSIISSRAEYVAWHHGLTTLARTVRTEKFEAVPPKAPQTPWLVDSLEPEQHTRPVVPTSSNRVSDWGTLPLTPHRDRKGPPLRTAKSGKVRYPLEESQGREASNG